MIPTDYPDRIKPGSVLLYSSPSVVDWLITRTGPAAHVELYEGNGQSLASRNGIGVNRYPFRAEGLIGVLTPNTTMTMDELVLRFTAWFETVKGDAYDWNGLAGFIVDSVRQEQNHWFCSAFVAKGFQIAGFPLFNPLWSPSLITPSDFFKTSALHWQWAEPAQLFDKSA